MNPLSFSLPAVLLFIISAACMVLGLSFGSMGAQTFIPMGVLYLFLAMICMRTGILSKAARDRIEGLERRLAELERQAANSN